MRQIIALLIAALLVMIIMQAVAFADTTVPVPATATVPVNTKSKPTKSPVPVVSERIFYLVLDTRVSPLEFYISNGQSSPSDTRYVDQTNPVKLEPGTVVQLYVLREGQSPTKAFGDSSYTFELGSNSLTSTDDFVVNGSLTVSAYPVSPIGTGTGTQGIGTQGAETTGTNTPNALASVTVEEAPEANFNSPFSLYAIYSPRNGFLIGASSLNIKITNYFHLDTVGAVSGNGQNKILGEGLSYDWTTGRRWAESPVKPFASDFYAKYTITVGGTGTDLATGQIGNSIFFGFGIAIATY